MREKRAWRRRVACLIIEVIDLDGEGLTRVLAASVHDSCEEEGGGVRGVRCEQGREEGGLAKGTREKV